MIVGSKIPITEMPNKCSAFGCRTNYDSCVSTTKKLSTFGFPLEPADRKDLLLPHWLKFVNRSDYHPSTHSVLCELHFDDKYIIRGKKKDTLNWDLNPIPQFHSTEARKRQSTCETLSELRKPPKVRIFQPDEMNKFTTSDVIKNFEELDAGNLLNTVFPAGFHFEKSDDSIVFYRINFDIVTKFPAIHEAIKIDKNLHVQLEYNGNPVPLPVWFVNGHNARLTHVSMLENFPGHIKNAAEQHPYSLLEELGKRQNYKPKGRPPYSAEMIRYALLLRYTSAQAYKMLLEKFPLPSFSLLQKLHKGGVGSIKAAKVLMEKGKLSSDIILMADEMFLQKGTQYHGGDYVGANEDGTLYKGVVVFMICGLKQNVSTVIKACPETGINGKWLCNEFIKCIDDLINVGFKIRGIVTDNHSSNVNAFKRLLKQYLGDGQYFINFPGLNNKIYLFFDTVHLLKNVRNNLLNVKKFVFPAFSFAVSSICITSELHKFFDKDKDLPANLRKAPKLSYMAEC